MTGTVVSLVCLLISGTSAGGKYWWMGSGDAFGDDYQDNQINNNQYQDNGQGFINNNNNVLPITQNLEGSCPVVSQVPLSQCGGRTSDCWSVGQPDVDCIDNALCCFDGCANVCQGSGSRSPAPPPNPRPPVTQAKPQPQLQQSQPQPQYQPQPKPAKPRPVKARPARKPKPNRRPPVKKDPWPQQQQQQSGNNFQQNNGAGRRPSAPAASKPFVR